MVFAVLGRVLPVTSQHVHHWPRFLEVQEWASSIFAAPGRARNLARKQADAAAATWNLKHCEKWWKKWRVSQIQRAKIILFWHILAFWLEQPLIHANIGPEWSRHFGPIVFGSCYESQLVGWVMLWGSPIRFPPSLRSKCVDSRKECATKRLHKLQVLCLEGVKHLDKNQSLDCDTAKTVRVHCPSAAFCYSKNRVQKLQVLCLDSVQKLRLFAWLSFSPSQVCSLFMICT